MDAEIKAKWLAALRGGEYQQARGKLRTVDDKHCCLGVLCDVAAPHQWQPGTEYASIAHDGFFGVLSMALQNRLGITQGAENHLSAMNDCGKSFAEIADWIEANL